jgi:hypothetical protein
VIRGRRRFFGAGLGVGILLGLLFGSVLVARVGDEAAEAFRSLADRLLHRRDDIRFEALLQ